tara:strand:- start:3817 stop:4026 length:210 start_codon:yes stop_codon:yes gene_type:complete
LVSFTRRAVWNGDFDFSIVEESVPEAIKCLSELDFSEFKGKFYSLDNIVAGFKNSIDANNIKTFIKPNA